MTEPSTEPLPDWRAMWDFQDADATEVRFREAIAAGRERGDAAYVAIVTTQLARTFGLRKRFDEAHATLDLVESAAETGSPELRIRYLLERGRAFNSGGRKDESVPLFEEAWRVGREAGLDGLAVDAAHMLAIVLPPDPALEWTERAMALCEASDDPRCKGWLGPLYNNSGWTHFDRGDYHAALERWEKGLAVRRAAGTPHPLQVARYTVARAWRMLGRHEEALAESRSIRDARAEAGLEPDGFVSEEIAENLEALGRTDEAAPWYAEAWSLLQSHDWLATHERERWERLRQRAGAAGDAG